MLLSACISFGIGLIYIKHYEIIQKDSMEKLSLELGRQKQSLELTGALSSPILDNVTVHITSESEMEFDKTLKKKSFKKIYIQKISKYNLITLSKFSQKDILLVALKPMPNMLFPVVIKITLYLFLVCLFIMVLFNYFINSKVDKKIEDINDAAKEIMQGDLGKRILVNPARNDEISNLSRTLNQMLTKISKLMNDIKQVNSNIAHDLKTPLNRVKARMEVALIKPREISEYEDYLEKSITDLDNLEQTFSSLLLIANLNSGNTENHKLERVSLSLLLKSLAEFYEVLSDEAGHKFYSNISDNIYIDANKNLFAQAISNLLDNAIKYTPTNGKITLSLAKTNGFIIIKITDNGIGISKSDHAKVFERFTRLDKSRSLPGTGLGLSLVKSILGIHKARLKLFDNKPGLGITITLNEPLIIEVGSKKL